MDGALSISIQKAVMAWLPTQHWEEALTPSQLQHRQEDIIYTMLGRQGAHWRLHRAIAEGSLPASILEPTTDTRSRRALRSTALRTPACAIFMLTNPHIGLRNAPVRLVANQINWGPHRVLRPAVS